MQQPETGNLDPKTVASFGDEWSRFDQTGTPDAELQRIFDAYFHVFPWHTLPPHAVGFDMGCGSGRWAKFVAPRVGQLHCIDPSQAIEVARRNLSGVANITFHQATTDSVPLAPASQDFGYALGVLHHIPDTEQALRHCVMLLKPNAPFLLYLYYRFDNRPRWFRVLWAMSDLVRKGVCRLPSTMKHGVTDTIALIIYWPLARLCFVGERLGLNTSSLPLHGYHTMSFYTMRTDSRDRFGTPLEQRFTQAEIEAMMQRAGLHRLTFSPHEPFWCAIGYKR